MAALTEAEQARIEVAVIGRLVDDPTISAAERARYQAHYVTALKRSLAAERAELAAR